MKKNIKKIIIFLFMLLCIFLILLILVIAIILLILNFVKKGAVALAGKKNPLAIAPFLYLKKSIIYY